MYNVHCIAHCTLTVISSIVVLTFLKHKYSYVYCICITVYDDVYAMMMYMYALYTMYMYNCI